MRRENPLILIPLLAVILHGSGGLSALHRQVDHAHGPRGAPHGHAPTLHSHDNHDHGRHADHAPCSICHLLNAPRERPDTSPTLIVGHPPRPALAVAMIRTFPLAFARCGAGPRAPPIA